MTIIHGAGLFAALISMSLACQMAAAEGVKAGDLSIENAWTRATPGGAQVAGGYVTISNKGKVPDRLVGGSLAAATNFELHRMSTVDGVMTMRPTGPLEVPAGGQLTLEPSATHIMFTGLKHGLKLGETIDGTLIFEHTGTVPVRFDVEGIGARKPAASESSGRSGQSMPKMDMN